MNKLSLIKSINNLTHMKSINSLSLVKNIMELSIKKHKNNSFSILIFTFALCLLLYLFYSNQLMQSFLNTFTFTFKTLNC